MSEFMRPISFKHLIEWSLEEFKNQETIFGIHKDKFYRNTSGNYLKTVLEMK